MEAEHCALTVEAWAPFFAIAVRGRIRSRMFFLCLLVSLHVCCDLVSENRGMHLQKSLSVLALM